MFGMIPFVKAAGRGLGKIFKGKEAEETLQKEVDDLGLDTSGVDITVNDDGTVSVKGQAVSQEMKEKIILAVGNVEGVGGVADEADVNVAGPGITISHGCFWRLAICDLKEILWDLEALS